MTRIFQQYFKLLFCFLLFNWCQLANGQINFAVDSLDLKIKPDTLPKTTGIDSAKLALESKADSLSSHPAVLDSLQLSIKDKIDSLKALNLPYETYAQRLDSLRVKYSQKLKAKVPTVNKLEKSIEKKLAGKTNLNDVDLPNNEIPKMNVPDAGTNIDIPDSDIDLGKTAGVKNKMTGANPLKGTMSKVDKVKGMPNEKVEVLQNTDQIKKATQGLEEVKEYTNQAGEYQKDLAKAKKGNWQGVEKRAEEEAIKNFEGIGELQQQIQEKVCKVAGHKK